MNNTEKRFDINIAGIIAKMKEEIQEHGDMHGAGCPCNMEDTDECDCEEIAFWGQQIENYMVKVDQWWIAHAKEHRKLCTPDGNKMLTKMMGKKNRDTSIAQAIAEERERLMGEILELPRFIEEDDRGVKFPMVEIESIKNYAEQKGINLSLQDINNNH